MYSPVPIARESVISKAADEIRRLIREQQLAVGAPLPTETHLSRMLGISRSSLREALRILHGLGFVQKHPGRRVTVSAATAPASRSFDARALADAAPALHQMRMAIEQRAAALAAVNATDAEITEMESHIAGFTEALKRGDVGAVVDAHEALHLSVVTAARNPILTSLFTEVRGLASEISTRGQVTLKERRQLSLHGAIVAAIRARDAKRAEVAVRRHFQTVAPLLEFISRDSRGEG
jgi:DNA-binding FadR family transcriptional regulator